MNEISGRVSATDDWSVGSEQRYLSILDASPDLICRFEPDTTLTFVNRAYAEYFQSSSQALIGRRFLEFVPDEVHADILGHLAAITPDQPSCSYEHVVSLPDGANAWQYWTDIGLFDEAGKLTEFQSIGRDVTDVHKLHEELEAKNLALEARDEELRLVLDSIPSRVWYKDDKNQILRLNEAAARSMGVSCELAEGANTYDLFGPMAKKYHDDDLQVIERGTPEMRIVERYTPASGEGGWVTTDKIPFPDPVTGEPRLLVVATDITELKRQEAQLQIVNRNLDNFASLVSHDLRAPLRHITVYSEMLDSDHGDTLNAEGRECLDRIRTSSERMRAIIDTFLDFARSTPTHAEMSEVELTQAMRDAVAAVSVDVQSTGAQLHLPQGPISVRGDLALLTQLFQNLFDNAIRFARADVPPEIKVTAERNAGFWTIAVKDNGIGIESSKQDTVFDLFDRGKPAKAEGDGGNGIGLALCRRIAVLHGGSIRVDTEATEGSRFLLSLEESREATT